MNRPALLAAALAAALPAGPLAAQQIQPVRLHGYVREAATGEPIVLAAVQPAGERGAWTDRDGYFTSAPVPAGPVALRVEAYGYAVLDTVVIGGGGPIELRLRTTPVLLDPLRVRARDARDHAHALDPQVRLVGRAQLRQVPPALQTDLLRSLQALPGVVAANPVSSRLMVRGGAPDQNQFLLDGFPVIYPYHLAGAFSAFHTSAVQDVAFWPGSPPARYGGHLSSVLDIELREGNREQLAGEALLGPVTSGAAVEVPVPRGAAMLAARRTYVDALARIPGASFPYHFWDTTAKLNIDVTPSDRLTVIGFYGRDRLRREPDPDRPAGEPPDEEFAWQNGVVGVTWRHLFGAGAVLEQRLSRSVFAQRLDLGRSSIEGAFSGSAHDVALSQARGTLRISALTGHTVELGYEAARHEDEHRTGYTMHFVGLEPEAVERAADSRAYRLAGYVEDELAIGAARLRLGLRGERYQSYESLQPRAALAVELAETAVLRAWWGRVMQYEHVLQDPDLDLASLYSLDIWLAAGEPAVKPARAEHFGLGGDVELPLEMSLRLDGYVKRLEDVHVVPEASPPERRVALERLELADGRVTGLDLTLRRTAAEGLTGWLGYSYTRARSLMASDSYPMARQPRQRLVSLLDWRSGSWHMNARFEAFEGLPYTPATASAVRRPFDFGYRRFSPTCEVLQIEYLYGRRNSARTPWSKRLDVGARYVHVTQRGWSWELGLALYNALFDPPGIFRPRLPSIVPPEACNAPVEVRREPELVLPALPSLTFRIQF